MSNRNACHFKRSPWVGLFVKDSRIFRGLGLRRERWLTMRCVSTKVVDVQTMFKALFYFYHQECSNDCQEIWILHQIVTEEFQMWGEIVLICFQRILQNYCFWQFTGSSYPKITCSLDMSLLFYIVPFYNFTLQNIV